MAIENQELTPEINPFDIQWLSDNFGLDKSTVKTAKLNQYGIYEIYFKDLNAAEKFVKTMREANYYSFEFFEYSNSVESFTSPDIRMKIIKAAAARQKAILPPLVEYLVKKPLAIEGMPEINPDTVGSKRF